MIQEVGGLAELLVKYGAVGGLALSIICNVYLHRGWVRALEDKADAITSGLSANTTSTTALRQSIDHLAAGFAELRAEYRTWMATRRPD